MRSIRLIVFASFLMFVTGCASTPHGADGPQSALEVGKKSFAGAGFGLSWIPSSGAIADATFLTMSASAPSAMARELAAKISPAAAQDVNLVVAGPNSAKSKRVLLDAISVAGGRLPRLRIVFLGTDSDRKDVGEALAKTGATLVPAIIE